MRETIDLCGSPSAASHLLITKVVFGDAGLLSISKRDFLASGACVCKAKEIGNSEEGGLIGERKVLGV